MLFKHSGEDAMKKGAGISSRRPSLSRSRPLHHPLCGGWSPSPSKLGEDAYAALGSAALACAMIALNASASCIAMSARTLRSRSMLASFSAWMNWP